MSQSYRFGSKVIVAIDTCITEYGGTFFTSIANGIQGVGSNHAFVTIKFDANIEICNLKIKIRNIIMHFSKFFVKIS